MTDNTVVAKHHQVIRRSNTQTDGYRKTQHNYFLEF